jgi:hypothetical protein
MCENCETLRAALAVAERELVEQRSKRRVAMRDANQAWQVARAPDATLRAMVAELAEAHAVLGEAHKRLATDFAALRAMVEG